VCVCVCVCVCVYVSVCVSYVCVCIICVSADDGVSFSDLNDTHRYTTSPLRAVLERIESERYERTKALCAYVVHSLNSKVNGAKKSCCCFVK